MKKYKILFLSSLALLAVACADLDELEPINSIPSGIAINNTQSANAAIAGLYDGLQGGTLLYDGWLMCPQFFTDEANATGTFPTRLEFGNLNVFPANTTMAGVFTELYYTINVANNIIASIPTITDDPAMTPEVAQDYIAQAKFVRAQCYLYLTLMWGDVPLITAPTTADALGEELFVTKNPASEIYALILDDLDEASKNLLRATGPNVASRLAANALLARVNLYLGNWEQAMTFAETVLGPGFDLTAVPFLSDQIYSLGFSTADGNVLNFFYGPSDFGGRYSIGPTIDLIAAFEPGDLRFAATLDTASASVDFGLKYPSFGAGISGTATDPVYFIRHSEMVLIAAEAAAEMDDFTTANAYFNQVRARAGLDPITLDAGNYVDAILHERFVEFAFEGYFRLVDLRRRGKALEVLAPYGYDACDDVWPLPQREIDRNPNLEQNDCCNC